MTVGCERIVRDCLKAYFNGQITKEIESPVGEEEWASLAAFIMKHRLAFFFYDEVKKNRIPLDVPDDILNKWSADSRKTIVFNTLLQQELKNILAGLKELDVSPALLKGFALHSLYDDILARPSSDIDLLIKRNEYRKAKDFFTENLITHAMICGFRGTMEQYIDLHENYFTEISFQKKIGLLAINIDLHWELDGIYDGSPLEKLFPIDKYPWQQYIEVDHWDGVSFHNLIPEMQFINLAVHFALHHQFQGAKWFLDILLFIFRKGSELNWRFIDEIVQEPDCRKILGVTLRLIESWEIDLPSGIPDWRHFWNGKAWPYEFQYFQNRIFSDPSKIGHHFAKVLMPLNSMDKLKVLAYYMFNKEAIILWRTDQQTKRIPGVLQPFYIMLRVYREHRNRKHQ